VQLKRSIWFRLAAALADSLMAFAREHLGVRFPKVGVEDSTLPVDGRQRSPKPLCALLASIADEHADELSARGVQG
jgi:hypothetical protein